MEKKILIIEDDRFYTQYLGIQLHKFFPEHKILTASNGKEGWFQIRAHDWDKHSDFIILDLEMPQLNGFGLIRMIKKHPSLANEIPPIVINTCFDNLQRPDFFENLEHLWTQKPLHLYKVKNYLDHLPD